MGFVSLSNTVPYLTAPGGDPVNTVQVLSIDALEVITVDKLDGIEEDETNG